MLTGIRGVLFDLDGTLIHEELDFAAMRREMGLPPGEPLLEAMSRMSEADRRTAQRVLDRHEGEAARLAVALPGVTTVLQHLDHMGLRRGVLTRNSRSAARMALEAAGLLGFDPVLTRDDAPPKPDPAGILRACELWQIETHQLLMVGDFVFDLEAGRAAGCRTLLISHGRSLPFADKADAVIRDHSEWAVDVVKMG